MFFLLGFFSFFSGRHIYIDRICKCEPAVHGWAARHWDCSRLLPVQKWWKWNVSWGYSCIQNVTVVWTYWSSWRSVPRASKSGMRWETPFHWRENVGNLQCRRGRRHGRCPPSDLPRDCNKGWFCWGSCRRWQLSRHKHSNKREEIQSSTTYFHHIKTWRYTWKKMKSFSNHCIELSVHIHLIPWSGPCILIILHGVDHMKRNPKKKKNKLSTKINKTIMYICKLV